MRRLAALALSILTLALLAASPADAAGVRVSVGKQAGKPDDSTNGHFRQPGHHQQTIVVVPQTVFVSPGRCWQPGYWTYQWVPQAYTTNTWVPSQWSPEGTWIEGHYAPSWYSSGSYHPLWVEGYWSGC